MKRIHYFNMIEIILAISIIAIGISSVMALFVAGIRTGKDTVTYNLMPNVTETVLSHIRTKIDECRGENGWDRAKLAKIAPTVKSDDAEDFSEYLAEKSDSDVIKGDDKGRFLYRQLSISTGDAPATYKFVPTFSAVASVLQIENRFDDIILSNPQNPSEKQFEKKGDLKDAENKKGKDLMDKFRLVVQVTLSYPAEMPIEQRESKTYIMEFFNDKYDRFSEEGEDVAAKP